MEKLLDLLNQLEVFIDQCPTKGRSRFGDAGYRDWHAKLEQVRFFSYRSRTPFLIDACRKVNDYCKKPCPNIP